VRPSIIESFIRETRRTFNDAYDAIFGEHPKQVAKANPPALPPKPATGMHISQKGLDFIYVHEAWKGVSNKLHWPGGASGVTLGPGYDMKERSAAEIEKDMLSIGVSSASAKLISGGAGLTGDSAKSFCVSNKKTVNLTEAQERKLLVYIVPAYEKIVRAKIKVTLLQHQFDALVCFAYNPAGRMKSVANFINEGKTTAAMAKIKEGVTSGGKVMQGLVWRRKHEVNLYVNGIYATSAVG
jgi:GH24 family phage-related lysozyme (muramidase)